MAYGTGALTQAEIDARASGAPTFIGENMLRDPAERGRWRVSGSALNHCHPDHPTSRLWNGRTNIGSKPLAVSGASAFQMIIETRAGTVDAVCVKTLETEGASDITVEIDDSDSFPSPLTIATFNNLPANSRAYSLNLNSNARYTDVEFVRVTVTNDASNETPPMIGEIILGQQRQLSRNFFGQVDVDAEGADADDFETRGRARSRFVFARGFRDFEGDIVYGGANETLDDEATLRSLYEDCRFGRDPVVVIPDPSSAGSFPHEWRLGDIPKDLLTQRGDTFGGRFGLVFVERPVFFTHDEEGA